MTQLQTDAYSLYWKQIRSLPVLTKEETALLIKEAQNGNKEALNRIIECNLRLVVSIARKYRYAKMPFADLVSEGNFGLYDAVNKFDLTKDVRFSTFATFQIVNRIQMAILAQDNLIHVPGNLQKDLAKIQKAQGILINKKYCEKVRLSDLSKETGYSIKELQELMVLNFEAVNPLHSIKDNNNEALTDSDRIIEILLEDESYAPEKQKETAEIFNTIEKWYQALEEDKKCSLLSSICQSQNRRTNNVAFYRSNLKQHDQKILLHSLRNYLFEKTADII